MRKSWGIIWRAVGVSPPSCPHLTRRAYAAPLAGFAATENVTPLIVNPAILPFNLCTGAYPATNENLRWFLAVARIGCRASRPTPPPDRTKETGTPR
ncbi:MAG TPA: hypothetical protein PLY87_19860 [Planctomycetaceae bacterium]|nr:hypothetical protein [Planctomycetaceae bacterium]